MNSSLKFALFQRMEHPHRTFTYSDHYEYISLPWLRQAILKISFRISSSNRQNMADFLTRYGVYFNEVDKVCIVEPEVAKQTNDLKEECKIYTEKIEEFRRIATKFISMVGEMSEEVENEKIKAIGARNILQSMEKDKENHHQQLQALITEKTMELERLKIQLNSLQKTEMEQMDLINQITHY